MGVISITEIGGRKLEVGEAPNLSCTREYQIISDIPNDSEANIRSQPDLQGNFLPAIFAPNPIDFGLKCTNVSLGQFDREDPFLWHATIRWSYMVFGRRSRGQSSDPSKRDPNPLMRPALFKWGNTRFQRALRWDLDGKQFRNSAGDWFDPAYMYDDSRGSFTITKNVAAPWNNSQYKDARDVVNNAPFCGFATGEVKLSGITGDESFENNQFFYTKVATFELAERNNCDNLGDDPDWLVRIPDRGYHYLDNMGVKRPILLADGSPVSAPVNLNTNGSVMDPTIMDPPPLKFRVNYSYDFSTLGLGL